MVGWGWDRALQGDAGQGCSLGGGQFNRYVEGTIVDYGDAEIYGCAGSFICTCRPAGGSLAGTIVSIASKPLCTRTAVPTGPARSGWRYI